MARGIIKFIGSAQAGGATTAVSITHGITIKKGNLVVLLLNRDTAGGSFTADQTWDKKIEDEPAGETCTVYAFFKIAGENEPASYTGTLNQNDEHRIIVMVFAGENILLHSYQIAPVTGLSLNLVCSAANNASLPDDCLSIIFGGQDRRDGTPNAVDSADNNYIGAIGDAVNQRSGAAYRIYTKGHTTPHSGNITLTTGWPATADATYSIHLVFISSPQSTSKTLLFPFGPKLSMPELLIPGRKPVGNVVIDRTNFYGKRLKHAYIFTDDLLGKDLAGNRDGVIVGNTITQSGNNLLSTGDNNNHRLNLGSVSESDFMSGRSDLTVLSKVFYQDLGGRIAPRIFDKSNSSGGIGGYQFAAWENNNQWAFDINNVYNLSVSHTFGADRIYEVGITIETDTEAHLNVRGIGTDTAAISGTYPVTTTTNAAIANWNHTTDRNWTGEIFYVYFFEGLLTDAQMEEVWNNPYQFLKSAQ